MNKLKASGIGLAAAVGTVAGIAMLPGPGVTAGFSPGISAVPDVVRQVLGKAEIVLLCTDCETAPAEAARAAAPQNAAVVEQDAAAPPTDSGTTVALLVLAPQAGSADGEAANNTNDAGTSGGSTLLPSPMSGAANSERAPLAGGAQPGTGGSAATLDSTAGTPLTADPALVSCSTPSCEAGGPVTPAPSNVSLPASQVNDGEQAQAGTQPPGSPSSTVPPRGPDPMIPVLPDLAQAPVPDVSNGLLPETPAPIERTVLTEERQSVPEPISVALLGIGIAALGAASARGRKRG